jgi:hypothetical protein
VLASYVGTLEVCDGCSGTSVGGKALNPIGAADTLGVFVSIAGPPCLGIC